MLPRLPIITIRQCTLSRGGGSGSGSGGGKCSVTNGGVFCRNRGHTGRTPVTCLRAAIMHPATSWTGVVGFSWSDGPDRRGVDELTKELERDESHGEEKWCGCTFHVQ